MSGIAIVIPNADFSEYNLGTVSFLQDVDVEGITISVEASYTGLSFTPSIVYSPTDTNQLGVLWSIISGDEYASINSSTGVVTIKDGADNNSITIRATSIYNSDISNTATTNVTYKETVDRLDGITITANKTEINTYKLSVVYNPENSSMTGVTYSLTSGSSYVTLDGDTLTVLTTATSALNVVIKAVSTVDTTITDTITLSVVYTEAPSWNINAKIGAMEGVNSGLFAAMTANRCTLMVKFTDDSTLNTSYFSGCIFNLNGSTKNNPVMYIGAGAQMRVYAEGTATKYMVITNPLYISGWKAGSTNKYSTNSDVYYFNPADGQDISGKCFIMNQSASGASSMFINGTAAGDSGKTTNSPQKLKYITWGWSMGTASGTDADYDSIETMYATEGVNAGSRPGVFGDNVKITNFIIVEGTYTTEADVLAARDSALVDIKFNADGLPYNAGSIGTLMLMDV